MYFGALNQVTEEERPTASAGATTQPGSATLPYREALEETERKQREEYQRDCANVTVLQTLERQSLSPGEKVRFLERKLAAMPRIIKGNELIKQLRTKVITGKFSEAQFRAAIPGVLHAFPEVAQFPFPRGYAVGTVADEVARARCQLSRARWEFMVWNRTRRIPGRLVRGLGQVPNPGDPDPGIRRTPPKIDPGIVSPQGPDPLDQVKSLMAEAEIKKQLQRRFRVDDEAGILDRMRRLREAFNSVPKAFAPALLGRLMNQNDPLAKLFRYSIATATRNEMISILLKNSSQAI
jgi:hypothetical protein